ncbi:hypothetical protein B484DRAFT_470590, partial [Ochromonadaceae sp. CCMP2298]
MRKSAKRDREQREIEKETEAERLGSNPVTPVQGAKKTKKSKKDKVEVEPEVEVEAQAKAEIDEQSNAENNARNNGSFDPAPNNEGSVNEDREENSYSPTNTPSPEDSESEDGFNSDGDFVINKGGRALEAKVTALEGVKPTVVLGDTRHFLLQPNNLNAEGLKSLRDCLANEARNDRPIDRKKLIPEETVKLITQTLKAHKMILKSESSLWEVWDDAKFFDNLGKIYPKGGVHSHRLQDALVKLEFEWYLDQHPRTLQSFLTALNAVMTTYSPEIETARVGGKLPSLEKECVKILLARLIASRTDDKRQPHLVRARLRELCKEDGEPATVDELIERLIANATFIVKAVTETAECGLSARRIGKHAPVNNPVRKG